MNRDLSGGNHCQGDFEDFATVEVIGKCILISRIYYMKINLLIGLTRLNAQSLVVQAI